MKYFLSIALMLLVFTVIGCQSYVTPGRPFPLASLSGLDQADPSGESEEKDLVEPYIREVLNRKPTAAFPAGAALVRIQESDYSSYRCGVWGRGRYSVVTSRDIERDKHIDKIKRWPMIKAACTLPQALIPRELVDDRQLRLAAAKLHNDLLVVYTIDASFSIDDHEIGPFGVITLGLLPNREATVTSSASAIIYDVGSGYIYGLADGIAKETQMTSIWASSDVVDDLRLKAESKAFVNMLGDLELTWKGIVEEYAVAKKSVEFGGREIEAFVKNRNKQLSTSKAD